MWIDKWTNLKNSHYSGEKIVELTLEQYIRLAFDSGIYNPDDIGRTSGKYQLGRLGDVGNYTVDNCRFITIEQNLKERADNGGDKALSEYRIGKTKDSHDFVKKMAETLTGRTKDSHSGLRSMANKNSKNYRIVSPSGEIFEGRNLTEFCNEHKISYDYMTVLCGGKRSEYKGWIGAYIG